MNKVKLYSNKALRLSLLGAFVLAATACSHSGGSASSDSGGNGANGDASTLQVITPKTIYSKPDTAGSAYVVINNPTNTAVKNLHYSLTNPIGSASKATIDSVSAAGCSTVAAYSQCNVKVDVTAGAVAGSFGFSLSNNDTLLAKLTKSAQAAALATAVGIEQAAYNSLQGADGITLSYYNTVINGTPYILVSGLVASNNAGTFDKVVLVNGSGTAIPNQQLISPVSNAQGSTFNILLPVPSANNASQSIKVQTQQNGTEVSTATTSSTLTTKENIGIADMLPSAVYLTSANPEQIITFLNTGDAVAQLQQLVSNNPNVEVVFSPSSLTSGTTTTATLKLKNTTVAATSGNVILSYNNGQSQTSTSGSVDQNVNPAPSPTPTPTPTPTPPPGPSASLTAVFSPDNDFFKTTAGAAVTRQLTLTNSGNTDEDNIVLTLPANFSLAPMVGTNACTVSSGKITNTLTANGGNCDIGIAYDNSTATAQATANLSIAYDYNNGTAAPTPTTATVNYKVTQSTANLSVQSPVTPFIFPTSLVDGAGTLEPQVFTIKNIGEIAATGMNSVVNSNTTGIFKTTNSGVTNACGTTLAVNESCQVGVQFGAIPDNTPPGTENGNLTVSYLAYPSATPASTLVANVSGQVASSGGAIFNAPANGASGAGYSGTWPNLSIAQNSSGANATITYTLQNTGTDAATNFVVTLPTAPTGWTALNTTCPTVTGSNLAANATCTITAVPDTSTANSIPSTTTTISLGWSDQDSPSGQTQNMQLGLPAVTITVPPPAVTITPVANWSTMMGNAYAFTAKVTGSASTVSFSSFSGVTNASLSPSSCNLDPINEPGSCTVIVTPYDTTSGDYSFWNPANTVNSSIGNEITGTFTVFV